MDKSEYLTIRNIQVIGTDIPEHVKTVYAL